MAAFRSALANVFFLPRLLGGFPFDSHFRLSTWLLAYCCLLRLFMVFCCVSYKFSPVYSRLEGDKNSYLHNCLLLGLTMFGMANSIFTVLWFILKKNDMISLFNQSQQILNSISSRRLPKKLFRISLFYIVTYLSVVIFNYNLKSVNNILALRDSVIWILTTLSTISIVGQFCDLLLLLSDAFEEVSKLKDRSSVLTYEQFSALYGFVNDIYKPHLLTTIANYFIVIVVYLQKTFLAVDKSTAVYLIKITWIIYSVIIIMGIIYSCNVVTNQMKKFNQQIYLKMIEDKSLGLLSDDLLQLHFVAKHDIVFTACGVFTIDTSLICSMISAATTYLVIVLQYGQHEDTSTEFYYSTTEYDNFTLTTVDEIN